ncbi:hypothetical protein FRC18_010876 [Serendipita sp. 400]|nr:hypothetical protein FRC18_010876 [Serendipita sp. 400]
MPGIIVKFALVLILCIQVTLWSHSRQASVDIGQVSPHTVQHWSRALVNTIGDDLKEKTCRPRHFPVSDQCAHVVKSCPESKTILGITYIQKYFCSAPQLRAGYFMGLIVWLIFLFSTLGISASDFFCPNLATISSILGLDENVAGVTFLALGNGSPDVFSTFSAMKAESGSLAVGELIGAASFILSVVVGSMALIKPFKVHRGPFLRDVGFFTAAIALLLGVLKDGVIKGWEAGLLVILYALYVVVVVVGSWRDKRLERRRRKEGLLRGQFGTEDTDEDIPVTTPYRDEEEVIPYRDDTTEDTVSVTPTSPTDYDRHRSISNATSQNPSRPLSLHIPHEARSRSNSNQNLPSYSLLGALEFRTAVNMLRRQSSVGHTLEASPITPYAAGHYHNPIRPHSSRRGSEDGNEETQSNPWEATLGGVALDERPHGEPDPNSLRPPELLQLPSTVDENGAAPFSPIAPSYRSGSPGHKNPHPLSKRQRLKSIIMQIFHTLFPTLYDFREKSFLGMLAALFAAPAVLGLTLTLPVVVTPQHDEDVPEKPSTPPGPTLGTLIDFEEEGVERALVSEEVVEEALHELQFNKWLMAVQCICAPLFCISVLLGSSPNYVWYMLMGLVGGVITAVLVALFADEGNDAAARVARTSMGFLVAIVWIMAIADEVVQVLQTFGFIFGLSDAIIGLTIFAVGNSLADFVANITVASFAPIMGFSACFGGPMLNILLGVGLSGTYIIQQSGQSYPLRLSITLLVSSIGLLVLLLVTIIFVPWNGYVLTRPWGIFLIAFYVVIMIINVVVEIQQDKNL